ncbi:helix-turn-helix domain-containing protein [Streptomyces sp. SID11233]|nr:helix-turn-helix transcriptional regulator [Streptomyces sp. SID11385]NEA40923.1 helix-turn-helix domain-containing protein [Streptomyces sp. SID11385]NED93433.1 helix-turn-helix domain-containing protein [Streptomyces sp. SID11233]
MRLVDPELLRRLMSRTGTGREISVRELAREAGVHPAAIGFLRTGERSTASRTVAVAIARRLGVDELVLWEPLGRSVSEESVSTSVARIAA